MAVDLGEKQLNPIFSVIVPIYDSELYLNECLDSVINQDIEFKENVELILINDASIDESKNICESYIKRFPDNIKYIEFDDHLGISAARNTGIDLATGEYLCFLDSDDKWGLDAFRKIYQLFVGEYRDLDCVFTEIEYFDEREGTKYVNDFYDNAGIIDIDIYYDKMARNLNSGFIKRDSVSEIRFPEKVSGDDEIAFITKIIIAKKQYGHAKGIKYYYRKRKDNTNAEQHLRENETYYTDFLQSVTVPLVNLSNELYDETLPYVQNILLDCVKRRLRQKKLPSKFAHNREGYISQILKTLKYIDEEYIVADETRVMEDKLSIENKVYALELKAEKSIDNDINCINGIVKYHGYDIYNLENKRFIDIQCVDIKNNNLVIQGRAGLPFSDSRVKIYLEDDKGNRYYCDNYDAFNQIITSLDTPVLIKKGFKFEIPHNNINKLSACIEFDGETYMTRYNFGIWSRLSNHLRTSYYLRKNVTIKRNRPGNEIRVIHNGSRLLHEVDVQIELIRNKRWEGVRARRMALKARRKKKKNLWLFIDRVNSANENAEFMFQYILDKYGDKIDSYYVISNESSEYERIKKIGQVLPYDSEKLLEKYLSADVYVISQTSDFIMFPSVLPNYYVRDLVPPVFAYMQHGVLEKDISATQNKLTTNFDIYVTSSWPEYRAVLESPYGFENNEVILTGLARYDLILPYAEKKGNEIIIAPTWRRNISTRMDHRKGGRGYYHEFKRSDFYSFYNSLINDPKLLDLMREKGYTGSLRLHPYMRDQINDFNFNDVFSKDDGDDHYEKQFENAALLVTDYSSIASDYAFAKKPVIYAQFDKDKFYEGHSYEEGFFDYNENGFGPVCHTYDGTVNALLESISNNCKLDEKYLKRREKYFAHFDGKNRERIYNEIIRKVSEK